MASRAAKNVIYKKKGLLTAPQLRGLRQQQAMETKMPKPTMYGAPKMMKKALKKAKKTMKVFGRGFGG